MNTLIFLAIIVCNPGPGGIQFCVDSETGKPIIIKPMPGGGRTIG